MSTAASSSSRIRSSMRARGTLTDRTSFETPSWARRSTWASSTASPGGRRPSSRCWISSAGRIFWFGNGGSATCRMTTSGPPTAATTGSPAPPAVASAAWIAWASCRGSAAGSTGLKARPAITTSSPRSSRQSALTDPLPMSRPMARRFRKNLRPIALSTTYRPFRGVGRARMADHLRVGSIVYPNGLRQGRTWSRAAYGHAGLLPQSFHSRAARPLYPVRPPVGKPGGISSGCSCSRVS